MGTLSYFLYPPGGQDSWNGVASDELEDNNSKNPAQFLQVKHFCFLQFVINIGDVLDKFLGGEVMSKDAATNILPSSSAIDQPNNIYNDVSDFLNIFLTKRTSPWNFPDGFIDEMARIGTILKIVHGLVENIKFSIFLGTLNLCHIIPHYNSSGRSRRIRFSYGLMRWLTNILSCCMRLEFYIWHGSAVVCLQSNF